MALINCKECGNQVSTQAKNCPTCGAKMPKQTSVITWIIVGIIGVVVMANIFGESNNSDGSSASSPISDKQQALNDVKLDFNWSKGGFDSIMMVDLKVQNNGQRDIKDFEVTCEHQSNSGTKIDSNDRVVYEVVKAGETKNFKEFNMGFIHSQAKSTSCGITDLTVM